MQSEDYLRDLIKKRQWDVNAGQGAQALRQTPNIRVAFGNKGLSGVEPLQQKAGDTPSSLKPSTSPLVTAPSPVRTSPTLTAPPPSAIPEASKLPTEMTNPRVGPIKPNTAGLSPIDRSVAVLDAQRQAATDFPSSSVTSEGEVNPPKMHHGFKDRLKSIGRGALIGLGQGGAGGAVVGAITGGVSPVTIDKIQAQRALQRKTAEVEQQLGVEHGRAQVEAERMRPVLEAQKIQVDAEYRQAQQEILRQREQGRITQAEAQRQLEQIKQTETERHNREQERIGQARIDKPAAAAGTDKVDIRQQAERQRKYDASQRELASLIEGEKEAEKQKNAAYTEYGNLQAQYSRQTDNDARAALKPQLDAAKDKAEKAQALYAGFGAKKTKAQTAIDENVPGTSQAVAPPGFLDAFQKKYKRAPTPAEIQAYARAAGQ